MSDLAELLARVEAATGPDRALGYEVHLALSAPAYTGTPDSWYGHHERYLNPALSIDAALALVGQKLPGADWTRHMDDTHNDGTEEVQIAWREDENAEWVMGDGRAHSTPLAILAALLETLIAQQVPA